MRLHLCNILSLIPGEEKKVFYFAFLGFLLSLASTLGIKFSDALFIINVGAKALPAIYTYISYGMILFSVILLYSYHRLDSGKIFQALIVLIFTSCITAYICFVSRLGEDSEWFWYALRISPPLLFYPTISSFWSYIDKFHLSIDAKRLFGLFCSMFSLGAMTTGLIMQLGILDVDSYFLLLAGLMLLIFYWVQKINSMNLSISPEKEEETALEIPLISKIKATLSHRYTLLMIAGNFFALLLWLTSEYNYLSAFEARFITDKSSELGLTRFMGICYSTISICSVIFGVFIYGRLINRFGIETAVLITPMMYLITFVGWFFYNDLFLFPLMGIFVTEGLYDIVDNSNYTLLIKGIPTRLKTTVRVIIESIFEPLGMLTSGLLLSYVEMSSLSFALCLSIGAVITAFYLRLIIQAKAKRSKITQTIIPEVESATP